MGDLQMSNSEKAEYDGARKRAERSIVEAEKFKEIIAEPPGEGQRRLSTHFEHGNLVTNQLSTNYRFGGGGLSDDDFFHLTCHVDPTLTNKIEKGELIDLEKLLPKDKKGRLLRIS